MKQYKLEILDMINFCQNNIYDTNILKQNLNNYFTARIKNKKLFTEEELKDVPILIEYIKKSFHNEFSPSKTMIKVQNLILLSRDKIYNETNYRVLKKLKNKASLNTDELCSYIKISFDSYWIDMTLLKGKIKLYLNDNDPLPILDLINTYKEKNYIEYEELKLILYSKKSISSIIEELLMEISNENTSYKEIIFYLQLIKKRSKNKISKQEFELIMKLFKYLEMKKYLIREVGKESEIIKEIVQLTINDSLKQRIEDEHIKNKIKKGDIVFTNEMSKKTINSIKIQFDNLPIANVPRIITIDDLNSPDLDGAFSIQKIDNIYVLNIYITDVPTFLKQNRILAIDAYQRATSYYVRLNNENKNYNIDMLPQFLSHNFLSLNENKLTNAINFTFLIGQNGEIHSHSIDRKRIIVTNRLTPKQTKMILDSKQEFELKMDLLHYKELCQKISKASNFEYLKKLSADSISNLVALPSIMVNYYIGKYADFAIYRENGKYVKQFKENPYTHSATPLRKFVSDINLAFFLNQKGVVSFFEKDLNYVEQNVDEIIEHLTEKDNLSSFVNRNSNFVKKYIK